MIIVKIWGGLGNQLFQYSFGRYLALRHNTTLKLDPHFGIKSTKTANRSFELTGLNAKIDIASQSEILSLKSFSSGLLARIERKCVEKLPWLNSNMLVDSSTNFNTRSFSNNCYYDGYWQSEEYFNPIADIIRQEIQPLSKLDSHNHNYKDQIISSKSVSLHIRRGDYLFANSKYKICSTNYYYDAIDYFKQKLKNPIFYIFSDDLTWARANFKDSNYVIVSDNDDNPLIDLYLMRNCKNHIIANSTFSWWGAWLNESIDKIVISPKSWFVNPEQDIWVKEKLLLKDWIQL
jgi:hypothetical protein